MFSTFHKGITNFETELIKVHLKPMKKWMLDLDSSTAEVGYISVKFRDWYTDLDGLVEIHKIKKSGLFSFSSRWVGRISFENDDKGNPVFITCREGKGIGGPIQNVCKLTFMEVDHKHEYGMREIGTKIEDYYN